MTQAAGEAGRTGTGDGRERRPGNPFIHSLEYVCRHLLGARPCARHPACPDLGKCSQSGVETRLETGLCREPWGFRKHIGLRLGHVREGFLEEGREWQ